LKGFKAQYVTNKKAIITGSSSVVVEI